MPSILDFLRLHNTFGQPNQLPVGNDMPSQGGISGMLGPETGLNPNPSPLGNQTPDPTHNQDATNIKEIFDKYYTPDNTASDRVKELLGEMPIREKPNLAHKLIGSIVGLGYGPEAGYHAANAPYERRLEDWKTQLDPWQKESINERTQNTQERIAANDIASRSITQDKNMATQKTNEEKVKISKQRADAYVFDKTHPNRTLKEDSAGHLISINPKDPNDVEVVTDSDGEPIKSSVLSDEDKLNLQHQNKLSEIEAQGKSNINLANVKESNTQKDISSRGAQSRATKTTPAPLKPQANKSQTESASQQRVRQANNAQNYLNQHPEAKSWLSIDNGLVTVAPIKSGIFGIGGNGLTQEKRDEILKAVNGSSSESNTNQPLKMKVIDKSDPTKIYMVPQGDLDKVDRTKYNVQVP